MDENKLPKNKFVVFDDVMTRDGIGIEYHQNGEILFEIFRDDTKKTRTINTFNNEVLLEDIEKGIEIFKQEIPWDFIED